MVLISLHLKYIYIMIEGVVSTTAKPPFSLQSVVPSCQAASCVPIHGKSLFL